LVQLQAANPDLKISFTVATQPEGLSESGSFGSDADNVLKLLTDAKAAGVKIDVVNIMAMDYFSGIDNPDMGQMAIHAAIKVHDQLVAHGMGDVMVGITPMIGLNDYWNVPANKQEIFTLQDAAELTQFAKDTPWVAGLGAWQLPRDRAHGTDTTHSAPDNTTGNHYEGPDPDHSDIVQGDWDFSEIFGKVTKVATDSADKIVDSDVGHTLRGLAGNDSIYGMGGNDTLDGGAGGDKLYGGDGIDTATYANSTTYVVVDLTHPANNRGESRGDTFSSVEKFMLTRFGGDKFLGNNAVNIVDGGAGGDALDGKGGLDVLTGGTGAGVDKFVFSTALNSNTNWDTITDFHRGEDKIVLDDTIFTSVVGSGITDGEIKVVSSGHSAAGGGHIVYNSTDGTLWYDANGTAGGEMQFAELDLIGGGHPASVTTSDFILL
jgi:hypothetical protein